MLDRGRVVASTPDGKPARMVGTHADIAERNAAEAKLAQAQKLESIGQFVSQGEAPRLAA